MTEVREKWIRNQARFQGIFDTANYKNGRFENPVQLSSFLKSEESSAYVQQAMESGLDGTLTEEFEEKLAKYMGFHHAVGVSSGQEALRLALRLAAEKLYGSSSWLMTPDGLGKSGALHGKKVFCSDFTTADMVNPIVFEGGEPVFIDSSDCSWSMDPQVLELAFAKYPDVKLVVLNHAYGFPGEIMAVRKLCFKHDALLIECAGEAIGASYWVGTDKTDDKEQGIWAKAGGLGDYTVLDFGAEKLMGPSGGALLVREYYDEEKARYLASGANASTPWNQHEEYGHSCQMSELDAAMLLGQLMHLDEAIAKKKAIYERYQEKLDGSLASVIPAAKGTKPNYWITAMTCESNIQFVETRNDRCYTYQDVHGTAAPMEIYDVLSAFHAQSRPVYKPMSMQPIYQSNEHFTLDGSWRMYENLLNDSFWRRCDRARERYEGGICLPSDISMTEEEQDRIIDIIYACYDMASLNRLAWA